MGIYRILFLIFLIPLISHSQGFFGDSSDASLSCADKYKNCTDFVDAIQAATNKLDLNINHDYISQMRASCGKEYAKCLPVEKAQKAEMEKMKKEFMGRMQRIFDAHKGEQKRIDKMMEPNFDKIDQRRYDEWLKQNPIQWWQEQERRRNALNSGKLPC